MELLGYLFLLATLSVYILAQEDSTQVNAVQDDVANNSTQDDIGQEDSPHLDASHNGPIEFYLPKYYVSCDANRRDFASDFSTTSCWNCKGNRLCFKDYNGTKCVLCGGKRNCILKYESPSNDCFQCNSKNICYGS